MTDLTESHSMATSMAASMPTSGNCLSERSSTRNGQKTVNLVSNFLLTSNL